MPLLLAQVLVGLLGIYILVRDSVSMGKRGLVWGAPRRFMGVLLLLPFPLAVLVVNVLIGLWTRPDGSINVWHALLIEVMAWLALFVCAFAAWLIGVRAAVPEPPPKAADQAKAAEGSEEKKDGSPP